jgi:pyruvate/2-oxoglutarate dehydrogenase complex dihydrolipoamide dehydrogenase (E3) component
VDRELVEALLYSMRQRGATFRLGEKVVSVGYDERGRVVAALESGKEVHGDALLYTVGRQTNADLLNLAAAGLSADDRGRIAVDPGFRTAVENIFAAGDVIGFPALASTSMEQGRLATCSMFGIACRSFPESIPYGIYTIPEISMVGATEQDLTERRVPYEVGQAKYVELAKGQMVGADVGLLKILFDRKTRKVLGVHSIGEGATEIIHIGQAVHLLRRHDRVFPRHGLQLPDVCRGLQSRGIGRAEQAVTPRARPTSSSPYAEFSPGSRLPPGNFARSEDASAGRRTCCSATSTFTRRTPTGPSRFRRS